jgi:hypothetical protein
LFWCYWQPLAVVILWITAVVCEKYEKWGSMKLFYSEVAPSASIPLTPGAEVALRPSLPASSLSPARIAVYEAPGAPPRVEEIAPGPVGEFIEAIASRVHTLTGQAGGSLPYTVVREVTENLIHAGFAEPVISILDGGATVRFADQGPGIPEKDRALLPGYTTAHGRMKEFIRGVGSGFPIVKDFLSLSGGALAIEDNLGCGSVITISSRRSGRRPAVTGSHNFQPATPPPTFLEGEPLLFPSAIRGVLPRLTTRQTQVLALVLESGSAGPSLVAKELSVGLSTAYRDLASLEDLGLIEAEGGKRSVTEQGLAFLDELAAH